MFGMELKRSRILDNVLQRCKHAIEEVGRGQ